MKPKQFPEIILFLNDNPLPSLYTKGVISGKELRLRSALYQVKEIHVLAPKGVWMGDKDNKEIGNLEKKVHIHHIPTWPYYLRTIPLFLWGLYVMRSIKPDLIEAESPIISGPAAVILSKLFNKLVVVEVRASYYELIKHKVTWIPYALKKFMLNLVYLSTLKQASGVIANSRYYQQSLRAMGISSEIINPGIQLQSIKVTQFVKKSKTTILGFLGRIETEKGVEILLEAMELMLTQKGSARNFKLLIAGEGLERERLESFVKQSPILESRVKFLGFQKPYDFFPKIDILVNPNIVRHPLEMVNVEAAHYGKPVICFGDDQIPETVIHNKTGFVVNSLGATSLAQGINAFVTSKFLLTDSARLLLLNQYNFTSQVKALKTLYERINKNI